jgi:hypothetical protein
MAFKGWIHEEDYQNQTVNPTIINLKEFRVYKSENIYSYFEKEDATKNASVDSLFTINKPATGTTVIDETRKDYRIMINQEISGLLGCLGGKITLPTSDKNGNIIKVVD